ncbi:MAG: J domain-containing protein [Phycisphaerae bacterium]|nr:J domain-containing protein [Phycisphaerae bacterium]
MDKITRDIEARKAARKILEIEEITDKQQIKKAYRRAAIKYHPDHNASSTEANKKFTLIKCAYELLAFDKPCENILEEINSWPGVPGDDRYTLENWWGHFLWWREKFFESGEMKGKSNGSKCSSCI